MLRTPRPICTAAVFARASANHRRSHAVWCAAAGGTIHGADGADGGDGAARAAVARADRDARAALGDDAAKGE
eukprot:1738418-Prymnesium_polylepis.1